MRNTLAEWGISLLISAEKVDDRSVSALHSGAETDTALHSSMGQQMETDHLSSVSIQNIFIFGISSNSSSNFK